MGWEGYESEMDIGMLLRKMYCQHCGTRLKVKKNSKIVRKGDEGFSTRLGHTGQGRAIGMSSVERVTYIYECPNCHHKITYDEQCYVAKEQRRLKKKVLE